MIISRCLCGRSQVYSTPLERVAPFNDFVDFCSTFQLTHGRTIEDEADIVGEFKVVQFTCRHTCIPSWACVVNVNVSVNVEFKVTLHEQVRYRGTLQY